MAALGERATARSAPLQGPSQLAKDRHGIKRLEAKAEPKLHHVWMDVRQSPNGISGLTPSFILMFEPGCHRGDTRVH